LFPLALGPLSGVKIDAPEMRCRCQEFHAYAHAASSAVAQVHNAALLFLLGFRVDQHQDFPIIDFVPEHQQAAVRAYDQCLAHLAELAPVMNAAERLQPHAVKYALAAAVPGLEYFGHAPIMRRLHYLVNCPAGRVFPNCKALYLSLLSEACSQPARSRPIWPATLLPDRLCSR